MSYAQHKDLGSNRTLAIVLVAVVNLALGYAIVTGLAYNVSKKLAEDLKTFDVEEEPPPPEEEPPPPEDIPDVPPPPMTPPPMVQLNTPPPPIVLQQREITTPPPPMIPPPPRPEPPPAPRVVETAKAKGSLQGLITADDYPDSALEAGVGGTVRVQLQIGANGRVTGCSVTKSAGNSSLDRATCSVLTRRARFTPAKDQSGQPTHDSYSASITWQVLDE